MKKTLIFLLTFTFFFSCQDQIDIDPPSLPQLPISNGGDDFIGVDEFRIRLNADDLKPNYTGIWKIYSGMVDGKVSFDNKNDPKTIFHGLPGEEYKLLWEVRSGANTTIDTVTVSFLPLQTEIINYSQDHFKTRAVLVAKSYDRGKWTIEGNYHYIQNQAAGGISVPDIESSYIRFYGYENSSYKITWTTWYGSKSASTTYEFNTGLYQQDEALEDLSILNRSGYYQKNENGDVTEISLNGDSKGRRFSEIDQFPALKSLIHLTKLELSGDGLQIFPEVITGSYHNLRYLNVSHNYFSSVPDNFGNLTELDTLIMNSINQVETLPASFGELTKLKYLELNSLGLKSLPESFSNLISLKYLNIELNAIEKLPEQFGNLRNLEIFRGPVLSQSIPDSFSELTKLKFCFFTDHSSVAALPDDFGRLTELNTLWLFGNYKVLPNSFTNLVNLNDLIVRSGTGLTWIPENIGNLVNLNKLYLIVQLEALPSSFSNLVNLQYLTLKGRLNYLPVDLGNLEKLEAMSASSLKLKEIPVSFGNLKNLKEFRVAGNEISIIPASVGNLTKINHLDVSRNKITNFPSSMSNLSNTLQQLFINGNNYSQEELDLLKQYLPYTKITTWLPGDD